MKEKLIDLHTHTNASDGSLSPSEFIFECKKANLSSVAVTDHDTTDAIDECINFGKKCGIDVIGGIELSAEFPRELHILGLFIDHTSHSLKKSKRLFSLYRAERNEKLILLLKKNGFDITNDENITKRSFENLGRAHIANALISCGYSSDYYTAFKEFLTPQSPYFVKRQKLSIKECINIIHEGGGIAFLAHPNHSANTFADLETLIKILKGYGIDGIECYHSSMDKHHSSIALEMAKKYNLLISAGSDFHGKNKPGVNLGCTFGCEPIYENILKEIKKALQNLK